MAPHAYRPRGMSQVVDLFVGLLVAVVVLGLLAKKTRIAYPILFVLGGAVLGFVPGLPHVRLQPDFIFLFVLPPLLFPAALFTSWRDFRENLRPILLLAIGLVLFTTVIVGVLAHYFLGLPFAAGFVLGAIISPPDAIAATAIAERLAVPRRIIEILKGESLVNDATALVAFRFAIAAVVTGTFSLAQATGQFFLVALGGIAIGLLLGWAVAWALRHLDEPPIEVTISLLTPFVAYLIAERLGVSGVLAVVSAGLLLGWRTPEITTSTTRLQAAPFWNMLEFLLNGLVFILIGLELPRALSNARRNDHGDGLAASSLLWYALLITVAVVVVRILWVFPATYLPRLMFRRIRQCDPCPNWRHVTIVAWTGMRGVVSLAAALALPLTLSDGSPFPGRDLIIFLTFVVILATLVGQGMSLPFLIRWLDIHGDQLAEKEERGARLRANEAALELLEHITEPEAARKTALERLRVEYEDRILQLNSYDPEVDTERRLFSAEYETLSREALKKEREVILKLRNESVINDEVLRRIQRDIDLAEVRLRARD